MSRLEFRCHHTYPSGFSLDVEFGSDALVTALFGPSGSGKTSILEMIAGLRQPDSGRLAVGGTALLDTAGGVCLPLQRRRIGAVFQDLLLFPHLDAEANLRFGQRRRRLRGNAVDFNRLVNVLELGDLLKRFPRNLSGGERQRVALGRALLSSPDLLVMDEPLTALDEALKHRILQYLERAVAEWRIPVLFVSHNQGEVRRLAEKVVVLDRGQVVGEGLPEDALASPVPLGWSDPAGPLNLLRLDAVEFRDDHPMGRLGAQWLRLPPHTASPTTPTYVQFPPGAVILSLHDIPDISVRNHLRGTVLRVVEVPAGVFVGVDVGQVLWAEVTPEAARELDLRPGVNVICLIKTYSLEIIT